MLKSSAIPAKVASSVVVKRRAAWRSSTAWASVITRLTACSGSTAHTCCWIAAASAFGSPLVRTARSDSRTG